MNYPGLIKKGSNNAAAVKLIKARLNHFLGNRLIETNTTFGESTEEAVIDFQKTHNLLPDGKVGELTWKVLFVEPEIFTPITLTSHNIAQVAFGFLKNELHVRELTNHNDGTDVAMFLKSVGLPQGYSWCMAFLYWGFQMAAEELHQINPLIKTGGVLAQWNGQAPKFKFTKNPKPYDIFIMDFGKGAGHCGIIESVVLDRIHTIEGNTSADPVLPTEDREGNGVFRRSRKISSVNKGFLRFTI